MRLRAKLGGAVCALTLLALTSLPSAVYAAPSAPAWKLLAVSGPTNIPPEQSEVQRVTVEATEGTFTLSRKVGEGSGTPVTKNGVLTFQSGSAEAKIASAGEFEVGERVTSTTPGLVPADTTVVACAPDCSTVGSVVKLSNPAGASGTSKIVKLFTRKVNAVTGPLHVGDELVGPGFAEGTLVSSLGSGTLVASKATTSAYSAGPISFVVNEPTSPLPYNATSGEVQGALAALPAFGPGSFAVTGGPGGSAATPYFVTFSGELSNRDVEPLGSDASGLGGEHVFIHVFTTVPGGSGTGEIVVMPANIGGARTTSPLEPTVVTVGPLPAGVVTAAPGEGEQWVCPEASGLTSVTCTFKESVPALHAAGRLLSIPIEVSASAPSHAGVPVRISGGGAGSATYEASLVISSEAAPFGPVAFWAGSFEADGSPSVQAGAHPFTSATYFVLSTVRSASGQVVPSGDSKDVVIDLPPGFSGNPLTTARCPQSQLVEPFSGPSQLCNVQGMSLGTILPLAGSRLSRPLVELETNLFNDVPAFGYAAQFSTRIATPVQSVLASVRAEDDFGVRITAPENPTISKIFGVFAALEGAPAAAHGRAFISNPTDCAESARQTPVVRSGITSWQGQIAPEVALPQPVLTGCDRLALHPNFSFEPTTTQGSSPTGATAHLHLPLDGLTEPDALAEAQLKRSAVTLPAGLSLNPAQADGLEACSEAQIGYKGSGELPNPTRFNEEPVSCPDGSKLGTVEAITPLLEEPLNGTIYLANQDENPFHTLIGLYLVIESERFGLRLKLPGEVLPEPNTGQLTAVFDYIPQQSVEDLKLNFRGGGPHSALATPEVCGTYTTTGEWEPWSAPESGPPARTQDGFTVANNCAPSAAAQPFTPSFEAGTTNPLAGSYSPLVVKVNRRDGEKELTSLDLALPAGVTAKLAGVPYCSDSAIAAAGAKTGKEEIASPSCTSASQIGTVDTSAGVGSDPFHVGGKLYLAGPYKGAALSAVVITPAVAGPFDLGNVVIRSPLFVDPETARVTTKSDPIPTILKGIRLKVRSVVINIDRAGFMLNPTSCEVMSISATLGGSGGAAATPSNRFQVGGCEKLKFKPQLKISLKGATKRTGHPALKAVLTYPKQGSYANIARAQVGLPHSEFLDQGNLNKTCTRPVLLAGNCPPSTVYGKAKAWTSLLDKPLEGSVYLVGGFGYKLPALIAELNGQIRVLLKGKVDTTKQHGIRNTFEVVPDAPVSRFVLEMKGGKKYSLLENSENLCRKKQRASARFVAQNGLSVHLTPTIANSCKEKHDGKGRSGKSTGRHKGKKHNG